MVDGVRKAIKDLSQNLQLSNSQLSDRISQEIAKGKPIPEVLEDCYPGLDNLFKEVIEAREPDAAALQAQIESLLQEVSAVGDGDLRVQAKVTPDTLGVLADSFNYMIEELAKVVGRVQITAVQVTNATRRIINKSDELTQALEEQMTKISQTTELLEAIEKFIVNVSHNSQLSDEVTQEALHIAVSSKQFLIQTVEGIMLIRKDAQEAAKKYKHMGEGSKEIREIVRSIESIADRTEKLALNPFNEAGYSLNSICGMLERQAQMIKSIAHDANEQTSVSEAIAVTMGQISEITQQMNISTQETAASMIYLAELTEQLRASVSTFRLPGRSDSQFGNQQSFGR